MRPRKKARAHPDLSDPDSLESSEPAVMPDLAQALSQALDFHRNGRLTAAEDLYLQVLRAQPNNPHGLHYLGLLRYQQRRFGEALAAYGRALAIEPHYFEALGNRARLLRELGRPADALADFDRALAIKPDQAQLLNLRGLALIELSRHGEALASFERAVTLRPDYVVALNNRGNMLQELRRPLEALASYDAALAVEPKHVGALYNRGTALRELQRPLEALASYDKALALKPDHVDALNNRGLVLMDLRRPQQAIASYQAALAVRPDLAEAHANLGCLHLLLGDFERGWRDHEWRWRTPDFAPWRRDFAQPLWLGEAPLAGQTILLHAEQGLGDAIQLARYVPRVADLARKVILEAPAALVGLFSRLAGAASIIPRGGELPAFDRHCPLLSLPLAFKTRLDTIPGTTPYLSVAAERVIKWKERLPPSGGRRVGIAWGGNAKFKNDAGRSIGIMRLAPLLAAVGIEFLSLQKDLRPGDREALRGYPQLTHLGDSIEDFDDTAAIISLLDLVISSDTSVVHLAGALGKPVWILLHYAADWRWLIDRSDSPWYPTARLFRQPRLDDWEDVIAHVRTELAPI
jgi:tetratricopeptide (TPR) repeat protein